MLFVLRMPRRAAIKKRSLLEAADRRSQERFSGAHEARRWHVSLAGRADELGNHKSRGCALAGRAQSDGTSEADLSCSRAAHNSIRSPKILIWNARAARPRAARLIARLFVSRRMPISLHAMRKAISDKLRNTATFFAFALKLNTSPVALALMHFSNKLSADKSQRSLARPAVSLLLNWRKSLRLNIGAFWAIGRRLRAFRNNTWPVANHSTICFALAFRFATSRSERCRFSELLES